MGVFSDLLAETDAPTQSSGSESDRTQTRRTDPFSQNYHTEWYEADDEAIEQILQLTVALSTLRNALD